MNWLDNGQNGAGLDCWGPVLNINRDPRWGRNGEGGTEDPFLMGSLGAAWSRGLQTGEDASRMLVAITIKHFVANSVEGLWTEDGQSWGTKNATIGRHTIDVNMSKYSLQDTYWPAFRQAIAEGEAAGVMCSYNMVRGTPTCLDPLQKAARDAWGFDGYVTSDSDSVADAWQSHKFVETGEEAACQAVSLGGCDVDSGNTFYDYLLHGVNESLCSMSDVDERLFNTFKVRFRLGLFDPKHARSPYSKYGAEEIGTPASVALNLRAAEESLVLLQRSESQILPLKSDDKGRTIAVIGPHGNANRAMIQVDTGKICPDGLFDCVESPFQAIQRMNAGGSTTYSEGCGVIEGNSSGIATAVETAKNADVVVLAVGITSCGNWWKLAPDDLRHCHFNQTDGSRYLEAEGHDRDTIDIPPIQINLIEEILALGKPTVVVLFHGGQISLEKFIGVEHVTLIDAFYPGAMGAQAIANSMFGVANRWGKLPYTVYSTNWTANHNMLEHEMSKDRRTYRYMDSEDMQYMVLPFGHGMSLTEFTLTSEMDGKTSTLSTDGSSSALSVDVQIHNAGALMKGDNVVQAYLMPTSVPTLKVYPVKALFDFQRIRDVAPGESTSVKFAVDVKNLAMVTESGDRVCEPGIYDIVFSTGGTTDEIVVHLILEGSRFVLEKFPVVNEK
jgi:beta-glucosidase-like glycosyl hydrolase